MHPNSNTFARVAPAIVLVCVTIVSAFVARVALVALIA